MTAAGEPRLPRALGQLGRRLAAAWAILALALAILDWAGGRSPSLQVLQEAAVLAAAVVLGLLLAFGILALFVKVFFLRYGLHALHAAVALMGALLAAGELARPQQDPGARAFVLGTAGFLVLLGIVGEVVFLVRGRRTKPKERARRARVEAAARGERSASDPSGSPP